MVELRWTCLVVVLFALAGCSSAPKGQAGKDTTETNGDVSDAAAGDSADGGGDTNHVDIPAPSDSAEDDGTGTDDSSAPKTPPSRNGSHLWKPE